MLIPANFLTGGGRLGQKMIKAIRTALAKIEAEKRIAGITFADIAKKRISTVKFLRPLRLY